MTRKVGDRNLLASMGMLEGAGWLETTTLGWFLRREEQSFRGAIREWESEMIENESEYGDDEVVSCVYGAGGSHRYFVLGSGEMVYSWRHGKTASVKAEALGFRIWK